MREFSKSRTRPELKSFDCTAYDPIESWTPEEGPVLYWLTVEIGDADHPGADLYYVPVANYAGLKTPEWKQRKHRAIQPIVIDPYSWDGVLSEVRRRIASAAAPDWLGTQELLSKEFLWEYDGM